MENREQQILAEIKDMMASIRSQLELLDAKMLELQQTVDPEGFDADPIELDIDTVEPEVADDDLPFDDVPEETETVAAVAVETVVEPEIVEEQNDEEPENEEFPSEEDSAPEAVEVVEPYTEPEPEQEEELTEESLASEPEVEETPLLQAEPEKEEEEEEDDDLPGIFDVPAVPYPAAHIAPKVKPSVAEVLADKQAWRTDMPGSAVKDVRSAISLNDRIIFINHLFNEDPILFQNVITSINSMDNLDQAVEYLTAEFPAWDMGSELVYRFMMAVRRRVK